MSSRACKLCGWEHPDSYIGRFCTVCGHPLEYITCIECGKVLPVEAFEKARNACKKCRRDTLNASWARREQKHHKRFEEWLEKVRSVPKEYPTLTEEQWLEACRYFDGCARCNSPEIDTRGFFIGYELGGRYCDWNIIPLCEKCAKYWDLTKSVFYYTERRDYANKSTEYRENLEKIVTYLGGKLDAARKAEGSADKHTE